MRDKETRRGGKEGIVMNSGGEWQVREGAMGGMQFVGAAVIATRRLLWADHPRNYHHGQAAQAP